MTGEVLATRGISKLPPKYETQRVRRSNLQAALLKRVPKGTIELRKRLISMENLDNGEVKLKFEDEMETDVDLVVGADGVRSIVRQHLFPDHVIKFTGKFRYSLYQNTSEIAYLTCYRNNNLAYTHSCNICSTYSWYYTRCIMVAWSKRIHSLHHS